MITTSFDRTTLANMEIALQRACEQLPHDRDGHPFRRYVAEQIIACAQRDRSVSGLSQAGYRAVVEVCMRDGRRKLSARAVRHESGEPSFHPE